MVEAAKQHKLITIEIWDKGTPVSGLGWREHTFECQKLLILYSRQLSHGYVHNQVFVHRARKIHGVVGVLSEKQ